MRDPVTGFEYPEHWVRACRDPALLDAVEQGLAVLTSSGTVLRRGFSTGTTAAAACKAAALSLAGPCNGVAVTIPCGLTVEVPVSARDGRATAAKYAGDYPGDLTAGLCFMAEARPAEDGCTRIATGPGIGRFGRDTPRYRTGEPAISPPARECIDRALTEACAALGLPGVIVSLSAPEGVFIGPRTLNPRVGVAGGISVLGTTGLVEPWDDHLAESVLERIATADRVVLTTGRIGLRYARLLFPSHEAVLAGARIREALDAAPREVVLCGLPGLILRYCDPGILEGTGCATIEELAATPAFKGRFTRAMAAFSRRHPGVRVVCVDRDGQIIADSTRCTGEGSGSFAGDRP
jgi:cobalt-precorrin-5B (C1)-methyltransferase